MAQTSYTLLTALIQVFATFFHGTKVEGSPSFGWSILNLTQMVNQRVVTLVDSIS